MDYWEEGIDVDDSDLPSLFHPRPFPPPPPSSSSNQTLSLSLPSLHPCSQIPRPSQTLNPNSPPPPPSPQSQPQLFVPVESSARAPNNSTARPLIPGPAGAVQAAMHRRSAAAAAQSPLLDLEGRDDLRSDTFDECDGDFNLNPWLCAINFLGLGPDFTFSSPISSIKNKRTTTDRIPQVVGIIKSCVPNGLGDLFITLKDPTGTIGASVHRKVLLESNLGSDISVGCVLILKQVVVFCPARSARCLNVTPNNVVKIFSKDCGTPHKQMMPSFTARSGASGKHVQIELGPAERPSSVRQRAETTADNEVRRNFNIERRMDSRKTGLAGSLPCSISSTDASSIKAAKPDLRTSEPKKLISRVSFAPWTDDQLSQLFSDYQDGV